MRKLAPYILIGFVAAGLAVWLVDSSRLFSILQPVTVCLSIMAAAIFVRLNRGMPSLDWKVLAPDERKELSRAIMEIAKDYVAALIFTSAAIVTLIFLSATGKEDFLCLVPLARHALAGFFYGCLVLSLTWMGYVVWRDLDIIRLQRHLIDQAADREKKETSIANAEKVAAAMRGSMVDVPRHQITPWKS